jgi:hypothetical protein
VTPSEEFERLTASLRRELIAHSLIQPRHRRHRDQ